MTSKKLEKWLEKYSASKDKDAFFDRHRLLKSNCSFVLSLIKNNEVLPKILPFNIAQNPEIICAAAANGLTLTTTRMEEVRLNGETICFDEKIYSVDLKNER